MSGRAQSRRSFLGLLCSAGLCRPDVAPTAIFDEVPSTLSRVTWIHDNAMSPERYLPETMGPGCAFLDYDNAWVDAATANLLLNSAIYSVRRNSLA